MNYWIFLIPLLTCLCGWSVVRIVAFYVFRSLKVKAGDQQSSFRQELNVSIGSMVESSGDLLKVLDEKITDPSHFEKLRPLIEKQMDDFLRNRLKEDIPMIGMLIGDRTIEQLKPIFIREIENLFPEAMRTYVSTLNNNIDFSTFISRRVAAADLSTPVSKLVPIMTKATRKAALVGLLIGLAFGLVQLIFIWYVIVPPIK